MSNKKQTAVDWLIEQIENKNGKEYSSYFVEFIEQAKAMEKENMKQFFISGYLLENDEMIANETNPIIEFEQLYKETYEQ